MKRLGRWLLLTSGIAALVCVLALLRFAQVTDHLYHAAVKDPERIAPIGTAIVPNGRR